jgi:hypothetical protein
MLQCIRMAIIFLSSIAFPRRNPHGCERIKVERLRGARNIQTKFKQDALRPAQQLLQRHQPVA